MSPAASRSPASSGERRREGPDARQQLAECEGLGEVVVRPGVEALDAVLERAQGGEHQHRRGDALGSQRANDAHALQTGQQAIEHDHVVLMLIREREALQAVARDVNHEELRGQDTADRLRHPRLVLDQKNAQHALI